MEFGWPDLLYLPSNRWSEIIFHCTVTVFNSEMMKQFAINNIIFTYLLQRSDVSQLTERILSNLRIKKWDKLLWMYIY